MDYKWVSLLGDFATEGETISFKGRLVTPAPSSGAPSEYPEVGNYICSEVFGEGTIQAHVRLPQDGGSRNCCQFLLAWDSRSGNFVTVGIDLSSFRETSFAVRQYFEGKWYDLTLRGDRFSIRPDQEYSMRLTARGSRLELFIDDVSVLIHELHFVLPRLQTGLWCQSAGIVHIRDYAIEREDPKAFVIMQYSVPYNELFAEVIAPVCLEKKVVAVRADQTYGPGYILSDILQQISSAKFIIAEISPQNQNVFFEVGYALAAGKPIIFVAEKSRQLPFDVSGFRVLFYEDSIAGKRVVEEQLAKYVEAILVESGRML